MSTDNKAKSIEFAPGCFDNFDGTQEELDALQADIIRMFESGELEASAVEVDFDDLIDDGDMTEDEVGQLFDSLNSSSTRNLQ